MRGVQPPPDNKYLCFYCCKWWESDKFVKSFGNNEHKTGALPCKYCVMFGHYQRWSSVK